MVFMVFLLDYFCFILWSSWLENCFLFVLTNFLVKKKRTLVLLYIQEAPERYGLGVVWEVPEFGSMHLTKKKKTLKPGKEHPNFSFIINYQFFYIICYNSVSESPLVELSKVGFIFLHKEKLTIAIKYVMPALDEGLENP